MAEDSQDLIAASLSAGLRSINDDAGKLQRDSNENRGTDQVARDDVAGSPWYLAAVIAAGMAESKFKRPSGGQVLFGSFVAS